MGVTNINANVAAGSVKPDSEKKTMADEKKEHDIELEQSYVDERSITICSVNRLSLFRKANIKVLGNRKETIGSSIESCKRIASNTEEVKAYFPALLGISDTNPDFVTRVKAWLSNIRVVLSSTDLVLDTTFLYNRKADYLTIKAKEEAIEKKYENIPHNNISALKKLVKQKYDEIAALEASKYKYGVPRNVEEYLLYRHCLHYSDVAKDMALINSSSAYRFYIKDEYKEKLKESRLLKEKQKAIASYSDVCGNSSKFDSVFIQICVYDNHNITEYSLRTQEDKENIMLNFVMSEPAKFNKICNDANLATKSIIEKLIARGELIRSEYNQQISSPDGTFIGSNMNEAVAYFSNPDNSNFVEALKNKLKFF